MSFRKLWVAFGLVVVLSFAVLGWMGIRIYQEAPPIPERVVTTTGAQVIGPGGRRPVSEQSGLIIPRRPAISYPPFISQAGAANRP